MDIIKSLKQISTDYSIFEKDQVLTHDQLNSISGFFDDQTRLTRVKLLGVGVACGLRISMQGSNVKVSKGAGVTTDGDLLYLNEDTVFDKFKLYDDSNPKYAPFYVEGSMITVYELVAQETGDERSASLNQFNAQTGDTLDNMAAVLFMESFRTDRDICSGTDCDNLGQDCVNSIKLLIVDKASLGLLKQEITTPGQAFSSLNEIAADRPIIPLATNTFNQLFQIYSTACNAIQNKLIKELSSLYSNCYAFLSDIFSSDPSAAWNSRLNEINTSFLSNAAGIQYYYDFLKDVVETYNHFRELLFGDNTLPCPDLEAFPKHLLLGNLVPGPDADENRTGFYPSPIVSRTAEQLNHARFLILKLDTLIRTFQVPALEGAAIRITPGMSEERPLEERAIPYYYRVDTRNPVHKNWNYRLHQSGMDASNYSYNAGTYGGVTEPLKLQIGRFPFFRIEGHIGQNVSSALSSIEKEIKEKNLPFAVRSVMLGQDRTRVVKKPGIRYTDLHRLHYVLRQDVSHQLDDVAQFNGRFKQQVDEAVSTEVDGDAMKRYAAEKSAVVADKALVVSTKLNRRYSEYQDDTAWKGSLNDTIMAAGEFKYNLGKVVKTEFTTPFDSLISNTHIQWLDWLDEVIKQKNDKEDEKLLLISFISEHPGIEHFAGVVRGGTFVLVYDENMNVAADFMLPYYCCDTKEEEAEEPPLKNPGLRPGWIIDNGISVLPSRDKFIKDRLDIFKTDQLEGFVKDRIDTFKTEHVDILRDSFNNKFDLQQKEYFTGIKDSLNLMGSALIGKQGKIAEGAAATDKELSQRVNDAKEKQS